MKPQRKSRFISPEARELMAWVVALDPNVKHMLRRLLRMGAYNIRSDYMFVRQSNGNYLRVADPGAWSAIINEQVGVALLRDRTGYWFLNGF